MIPTGNEVLRNMQTVEQPSLTWRLDMGRGRAVGRIDGLDAVRQAVMKILMTERYRYLIYNADYGSELANLIGRNTVLVQSELRRRIREALIQDDRVTDVTDLLILTEGDTATIRFTVISTFGTFQEEVIVNV